MNIISTKFRFPHGTDRKALLSSVNNELLKSYNVFNAVCEKGKNGKARLSVHVGKKRVLVKVDLIQALSVE